MTLSLPRPFTLLAIATGLALAACTPLDKDTGQSVEGDSSSTEKPSALASLRDDKQKVAWVIGHQIGGQLSQIKDEIDFATLMRSVREQMDGKSQPLDQGEAMEVMQAFEARVQARQMAQSQAESEKNTAEGQAFLEANGQKPGVTTTDTGLQYEVLTEGTGPKPGPLDMVRVHYEGRLLNGEVFDSSYARGEPVQFHLDGVIPGWREGVLLMPVGSKYRLWVPGVLAYGQSGTPGGPIGPNATLAFDVELIEIVNGH